MKMLRTEKGIPEQSGQRQRQKRIGHWKLGCRHLRGNEVTWVVKNSKFWNKSLISLHSPGVLPTNLVVLTLSPFWFFLIPHTSKSQSVPKLISETSFLFTLTAWWSYPVLQLQVTFICFWLSEVKATALQSSSQTHSSNSSLIYPTAYLQFPLGFLTGITKSMFPK